MRDPRREAQAVGPLSGQEAIRGGGEADRLASIPSSTTTGGLVSSHGLATSRTRNRMVARHIRYCVLDSILFMPLLCLE